MPVRPRRRATTCTYAAALSISGSLAPRKLDAGTLRNRLIEQGVHLDKKPSLHLAGFPLGKPLPKNPVFQISDSDGLRAEEN